MSTEHRRRIDQVLDPEFAAGLEALDLDELRVRRQVADEVETELSYYRRVLHGRMDLLAFELNRRAGTETRSIIDALPEILGAGERGGGQTGRLPALLAPDFPAARRRQIDRVLEDDFLSRLPEIEEDELRRIQATLGETEHEVSAQRKAVQQVFDGIQGEIARRYKEGLIDARQVLTD